MADLSRNPIWTETNDGSTISPSWENERGVLESHIIHVDSRVRDYARFPRASQFAIDLPRTYHSVYSVELLSACIPIKGTNLYTVLRILQPSDMDVSEGGQTTDRTNAAALFNPILDGAFVKIPLLEHFVGAGVTFWRRDELRAIKRFKPRKASLSKLEFRLETWPAIGTALNTPTIYPLAAETFPFGVGEPDPTENVSFVLEIVAQN